MSKPDSPCERVPPDWGEPLSEADYKNLEASWITRELADAAMLRRVDAYEGAEIVGQKGRDCAGLLFPYYPPGDHYPLNYCLLLYNPEGVGVKSGKLNT